MGDGTKQAGVTILAISGSLRKASVNTAVLRAAANLAPSDVHISLFQDLAGIPAFDPDLDIDGSAPAAVAAFREAVDRADGILIASPEYAHGVSGVLKNALDWLVSCTLAFYGKPVALLNTSPRTSIAYDSLKETIRTMAGAIVEEASKLIPLPNMTTTYDQILRHPLLSERIRACTLALRESILALRPRMGQAVEPPSRP
ncbi:MAG: NADPH-dependent FMN reductase [Spirochaetia bacterium]|jgi:NAD(P)H-dependent FMN reductase